MASGFGLNGGTYLHHRADSEKLAHASPIGSNVALVFKHQLVADLNISNRPLALLRLLARTPRLLRRKRIGRRGGQEEMPPCLGRLLRVLTSQQRGTSDSTPRAIRLVPINDLPSATVVVSCRGI